MNWAASQRIEYNIEICKNTSNGEDKSWFSLTQRDFQGKINHNWLYMFLIINVNKFYYGK